MSGRPSEDLIAPPSTASVVRGGARGLDPILTIVDLYLQQAAADIRIALANGAAPIALKTNGVGGLTVAVRARDEVLLDALLAAGAAVDQPNEEGETALMDVGGWATAPDEIERAIRIQRTLLAAGADPNARRADGVTVLMRAVRVSRSVDLIDALIAAGADPTEPDGAGQHVLAAADNTPLRAHIQSVLDRRRLRAVLTPTAEESSRAPRRL